MTRLSSGIRNGWASIGGCQVAGLGSRCTGRFYPGRRPGRAIMACESGRQLAAPCRQPVDDETESDAEHPDVLADGDAVGCGPDAPRLVEAFRSSVEGDETTGESGERGAGDPARYDGGKQGGPNGDLGSGEQAHEAVCGDALEYRKGPGGHPVDGGVPGVVRVPFVEAGVEDVGPGGDAERDFSQLDRSTHGSSFPLFRT